MARPSGRWSGRPAHQHRDPQHITGPGIADGDLPPSRRAQVHPDQAPDHQRRPRVRPGPVHRRTRRVVGALPFGPQPARQLRRQLRQEAPRQGVIYIPVDHVYDVRPDWRPLRRQNVLRGSSNQRKADRDRRQRPGRRQRRGHPPGGGIPGPVVLISPEPGVPFGRPPLSKTYLRSEEDLDGWYVRPAGWYAEHGVELRRGRAWRPLIPAAHTVTLDSGEELGYAEDPDRHRGPEPAPEDPRRGLPGIHYLRTVAECDAIKAEAVPGRRAVVVGMGFIGCEVAASLTQLGVQVTAVFPGQAPLERVLGGQVGARDRRHPPREGGRAAARGSGHRLRRGRARRGVRHRRR